MDSTAVPTIEEFKAAVLQEWTDPATIAAWQQWYPQFAEQSREATALIVQAAYIHPGQHVLDLAQPTSARQRRPEASSFRSRFGHGRPLRGPSVRPAPFDVSVTVANH